MNRCGIPLRCHQDRRGLSSSTLIFHKNFEEPTRFAIWISWLCPAVCFVLVVSWSDRWAHWDWAVTYWTLSHECPHYISSLTHISYHLFLYNSNKAYPIQISPNWPKVCKICLLLDPTYWNTQLKSSYMHPSFHLTISESSSTFPLARSSSNHIPSTPINESYINITHEIV